ncbi:inhibitor of vertebrate lysozyme family protein [Ralstonia sp. CHL-2022]|uniref:Inhibitor of vertebrate lysozyme family protein n=1 Tax=Ralstonia mojiangensis TaxID=2953895 RepID=A0ABT2LCJ3_9RALS|nr:inhibitor of vertebrate lysozyme family protein [Ralstonia mojiangensis]MCT7298031.1 inhibitor of vertebrate lysozyme family protein [Ralstonia mojiangensis]MCT7312368.1 inhibitor of vertebrate lysozyme family protein [Ralstonia mojiangensis]
MRRIVEFLILAIAIVAIALAVPTLIHASEYGIFLELTHKPGFQPAWDAMLRGEPTLPAWLRGGQGTSSEYTARATDGQTYITGDMCKPHDCPAQQIFGAFRMDTPEHANAAWAVLVEVHYPHPTDRPASAYAKLRWLGHPDEYIKALLMKNVRRANPDWDHAS